MERTGDSAPDQQEPEPVGDARAVKVSVSMPGRTIADVRSRVGKNQFSRYVTEAVERQLRMDKLGEIVDAHVAEHGPIDPEIIKEVEEEWRAAMEG